MRHPLLVLSPFPNIDADGQLFDGYSLEQSTYCRTKCKDRVCRSFHSDNLHAHTCPSGFSVITFSLDGYSVAINGVIDTSTNTSSHELRKQRRNRKIDVGEIRKWVELAKSMRDQYESALSEAARDAVGSLHDIKSIIGTILKTTESWIWSLDGQSLDDRLAAAPPELRTIYHSCRILESLLLLTDVAANPEAASFGQPRPASIHGMMFMLQRVFESKALKRGLALKISGNSFNRPPVFPSFILIPLVLIDNAIKYALQDTTIEIEVFDKGYGVHIAVRSYGRVVPNSERARIFEKGVRGRNVAAIQGSGLGLWIAQEVARLHKTRIRYDAAETSVGAGWNTFVIDVGSNMDPAVH